MFSPRTHTQHGHPEGCLPISSLVSASEKYSRNNQRSSRAIALLARARASRRLTCHPPCTARARASFSRRRRSPSVEVEDTRGCLHFSDGGILMQVQETPSGLLPVIIKARHLRLNPRQPRRHRHEGSLVEHLGHPGLDCLELLDSLLRQFLLHPHFGCCQPRANAD